MADRSTQDRSMAKPDEDAQTDPNERRERMPAFLPTSLVTHAKAPLLEMFRDRLCLRRHRRLPRPRLSGVRQAHDRAEGLRQVQRRGMVFSLAEMRRACPGLFMQEFARRRHG